LDVVVFVNKKRNKLKVLAKSGMYVESLPEGQTYDFTLRLDKILSAVGRHFGMKLVIPKNVYKGLTQGNKP